MRHIIEWRHPTHAVEYRPSREEAIAAVHERFADRDLELNEWGQFWDPELEVVVAYVGKKPSNSGRSKLPRLEIRIPQDELDAIRGAAQRAGQSLAAWTRGALRTATRK